MKFGWQAKLKPLLALFTLILFVWSVVVFEFSSLPGLALAATGVPRILSYQGRLLNPTGDLLGGSSGTEYCFRFSFYDDSAVGGSDNRLWPATTSSIMTAIVRNGVFNVHIGDTNAGGDPLDYNFEDNDEVYLQTEVAAKVGATCAAGDGAESFETLSPRQRIAASGYAINSAMVSGYQALQNASGTVIPVLTSGNLILGGINPQINATGTNNLVLQGGAGTGDIQFFGAGNRLTMTGDFFVSSTITGSRLQMTATSSQLIFQNGSVSGTISWTPTGSNKTLTIPDFTDATDTVVTEKHSQTLSNKTLVSPSVTASLSITSASSTTSQSFLISNSGTGNSVEVQAATLGVFTISSSGLAVFNPAVDSALAFRIQNASNTETLLTANTLNNRVELGNRSGAATPTTLLTLDSKSDSGDPTGFQGAMYYNSSTQVFRCYQNGAWANCTPNDIDWQSSFSRQKWGYMRPAGVTATTFTAVGLTAPTASGTAAASAQTEDRFIQYTSAATTNQSAGIWQNAMAQTRGNYRPKLTTRIRTDSTIDNRRIWVGLTNAKLDGTDGTGALATRYVGVRYSTAAGDTEWQCASGDGTTGSVVSTGVTVVTSTAYDIMVDWSVNGTLTCGIKPFGSDWVLTPKTNNLDTTQTANLGMYNIMTTLTALGRVHRISYMYLGENK